VINKFLAQPSNPQLSFLERFPYPYFLGFPIFLGESNRGHLEQDFHSILFLILIFRHVANNRVLFDVWTADCIRLFGFAAHAVCFHHVYRIIYGLQLV
jgi:hypothetical protein